MGTQRCASEYHRPTPQCPLARHTALGGGGELSVLLVRPRARPEYNGTFEQMHSPRVFRYVGGISLACRENDCPVFWRQRYTQWVVFVCLRRSRAIRPRRSIAILVSRGSDLQTTHHTRRWLISLEKPPEQGTEWGRFHRRCGVYADGVTFAKRCFRHLDGLAGDNRSSNVMYAVSVGRVVDWRWVHVVGIVCHVDPGKAFIPPARLLLKARGTWQKVNETLLKAISKARRSPCSGGGGAGI